MKQSLKNIKILTVLCVMFLAACSSTDQELESPYEGRAVESIYNEAAALLDQKEYRQAASLFEEVERQYPYSQWATRAELMAAFAYYKAGYFDESVLAVDRFIELHPGHEDIDYALYIRALSFYDQISDVARDQEMTRMAMEDLQLLVRRFPDSRYARDARFKLDLTNDHLAGKEMEIGRYYLTRNHVNASINRFRTVVQEYQTTTHVPEALHRLVEAYLTLGLKDEATRVAAVLGYNYPGNIWYERSYQLLDDKQRARIVADRDWVDRTVDSLFKPD